MKKNSAKQKEPKEESELTSSTRGVMGTVTSNKMNKTIVVQVMRMVKHPLYGKYQRRYSKMVVHDAENQCKVGDVVMIQQTRPISKTKRWKLVEIVRRVDHTLDAPEFALDVNSAA